MGDQPLKLLVTGALGYVGRFLVDALGDAGHAVVAHARRTPPTDFYRRAPHGTVVADLSLLGAIDAALDEVDAVVHCAASMYGEEEAIHRRNNVAATEQLLRSVRKAGCPRLVHLSSFAVYGKRRQTGTTEDAPLDRSGDPYTRTKILAEDAVRAADDLETVILRPGLVWGGPDDERINQRLERLLRSRIFVFPGRCDTPLPMTHIANLAEAVSRSLTVQGERGEAFNITDAEPVSLREFVEALARDRGLPPPRIALPLALIRPAVRALDLAARIAGVSLQKDESRFRLLNEPCYFDIEKAREHLGYHPRAREFLGDK